MQNKSSEEGQRALHMVVKSLECMEKGGIHDHVGQVELNSISQSCASLFSAFWSSCVKKISLPKQKRKVFIIHRNTKTWQKLELSELVSKFLKS